MPRWISLWNPFVTFLSLFLERRLTPGAGAAGQSKSSQTGGALNGAETSGHKKKKGGIACMVPILNCAGDGNLDESGKRIANKAMIRGAKMMRHLMETS